MFAIENQEKNYFFDKKTGIMKQEKTVKNKWQ